MTKNKTLRGSNLKCKLSKINSNKQKCRAGEKSECEEVGEAYQGCYGKK
jgi:hypothetical protein